MAPESVLLGAGAARLFSLVTELPADVLTFHFQSRLLPMRHVAWFWAASLALRAFMVLAFPLLVPLVGTGLGAALGLALIAFQTFVLPVLFCPRAGIGRNLLVCALAEALNSIANGVLAALAALLPGVSPDVYATTLEFAQADPASFAAHFAVNVLAPLVSMGPMLAVTDRRQDDGAPATHLRAWPFVAAVCLVALEAACASVTLSVTTLAPGVRSAVCAASALVLALALLALATLVSSQRKYARQQAAQARMRRQEQMLADELAHYGNMLAQVEDVARMRHDMKNQLSMAAELVEQGHAAQAREHLQAVIARLSDEEGGEER